MTRVISLSEYNHVNGKALEELEAKYQAKLRLCAELIAGCVTARLTGTRDPETLYRLHIFDCLVSVSYLPESGRIIDVGSGGGLPGLVWAICRQDLQVTLLDSIGKKCRAVENIAHELGLSNVQVICNRAEDFARVERENFDLACARAVASAGITVELLAPFVRDKGTLLTFKGAKLQTELAEIQNQWRKLGLQEPEIIPYALPDDSSSSRSLVLWKRKGHCPRIYPRSVGMAEKKGWWL